MLGRLFFRFVDWAYRHPVSFTLEVIGVWGFVVLLLRALDK